MCVMPSSSHNHHYHSMIEIEIDQTAIATAVMGNISLYLGIQIQKYAKKKIIELALDGISTRSLQQLWSVGLAVLIISECAFFITYGLNRSLQMLPIGVFTIISNTTLPPLYFEKEAHTIKGSLSCQSSISFMIAFTPPQSPDVASPGIDLSSHLARYSLVTEITGGLVLVFIRAYKPANCSVKIAANCGLSALMGSHAVTLTNMLFNYNFSDSHASLFAAGIIITFSLEVIILYETVTSFPVWQVVAHHFAIFHFLIFVNETILFAKVENSNLSFVHFIPHLLLICGVWISAQPHLDIPSDIGDIGIMPELEARALSRREIEASDEREDSTSRHSRDFRSAHGQECLRVEYCKMMHAELKQREGICGFQFF